MSTSARLHSGLAELDVKLRLSRFKLLGTVGRFAIPRAIHAAYSETMYCGSRSTHSAVCSQAFLWRIVADECGLVQQTVESLRG